MMINTELNHYGMGNEKISFLPRKVKVSHKASSYTIEEGEKMDKWISRKKAAASLNLSISTLGRLIKRGIFGDAVIKVNRRVLISSDIINNLGNYIKSSEEKEV